MIRRPRELAAGTEPSHDAVAGALRCRDHERELSMTISGGASINFGPVHRRGDGGGCGCGALLGAIFIVILVVSFVIHHKRQFEVAGMVGAGLVLVYALRYKLDPRGWTFPRKRSATAPPVPLASLAPGQSVFTFGLVRHPTLAPKVPFSSEVCAWSRVRVSVGGALVADVRTEDVIVLEDGAGASVEVDVSDAEIVTTTRSLTSAVDAPLPDVLAYCAERGIATAGGDVDVAVAWLPLREMVFVRGRVDGTTDSRADGAYRASDRSTLRIVADGPKKVHMSPDGA